MNQLYIPMRSVLLCFPLTILIYSSSFPQQGKLYINHAPTDSLPWTLSYISYPGGQITGFDSIDVSDWENEAIEFGFGVPNPLVTQRIQGQSGGLVLRYDFLSHQRDTIIHSNDAYKLQVWRNNSNLVVLHQSPPYVRVYDMNLDYQPLFEIDTSKVAYAPTDMLIREDDLFLLIWNKLVWLDLGTQDTVASFDIPIPFFQGAEFPVYLSNISGFPEIYIYIDYATGAIRSSLASFSPSTQTFDTTFHVEGAATIFPPVPTTDKIFLYGFDSHYDLTTDSLYLKHNIPQSLSVLAYDDKSNVLFVYNSGQREVFVYRDSLASDTTELPGLVWSANFAPKLQGDAIDPILAEKSYVSIYPNPGKNLFHISLESPVHIQQFRLLDSRGKLIQKWPVNQLVSQWDLKIEKLSKGIYYLMIESKNGTVGKKIIVR